MTDWPSVYKAILYPGHGLPVCVHSYSVLKLVVVAFQIDVHEAKEIETKQWDFDTDEDEDKDNESGESEWDEEEESD